jgi:drug/metabolite transporter superfamily protein YnfA
MRTTNLRTLSLRTMNPEPNVNTNREPTEPRSVNESILTRREVFRRVTAVLGGVALADGDRLLAAVPEEAAQRAAAAQGVGSFTAADVAFLDEVAETILPETDTPGAKAAQTGAFMALMVTDAYSYRHQAIFRDGMRQIDAACQRESGAPFVQARPEQRLALLQRLDRERQALVEEREAARTARAPAAPASDQTVHYFQLVKELALLGYFTSEIGYRQAMRYIETPGRFDPCATHAPGEKIWAPHA